MSELGCHAELLSLDGDYKGEGKMNELCTFDLINERVLERPALEGLF